MAAAATSSSSSASSSSSSSSGATISEIYQKARHSLLVVRDDIERLERLESSSASSSSSSSSSSMPSSSSSLPLVPPAPPLDVSSSDLAQQTRRDLSQLQQYSLEMEQLWRSQITKPHRDLWKRKVEQIAEEADSLKMALDKYLGRKNQRQLEAKQRAELFQRTKGDGSEGARIIQVYDAEMQALQSTRNSSRMLEEAYATGVAILTKYSQQGDRLKRAQRQALDILNTVGLSNSVLKLIERRHRVDKWIAYVGMAVTVIIVFGVWFWFR